MLYANTTIDIYHNVGSQWPGWAIYIILLVPTLIFNVATIGMILSSPLLKNKINPLLVVYLAIEDGFLTLFCLLSCASDFFVDGIYLRALGCTIQSFYIVFFMLSTGYTLCCIAYHNERRVKNLEGLNMKLVLQLHIFIWIWSGLIAGFSTTGPDTRARVMPSGIYCLVSLRDLLSGLLFFIPGILTIGTFLVHRYTSLFLHIRKFSRVQTESVPTEISASGSTSVSEVKIFHMPEATIKTRVKAAKKMFVFIVCFLVCGSPVLILSLYEMGGTDAPGEAHIAAGFFIHLNSLLNPFLYFWTNRKALEHVPFLKKYFSKEAEISMVDVKSKQVSTKQHQHLVPISIVSKQNHETINCPQ